VAADSDSDDDESRDSMDGEAPPRGQQRDLSAPIGGPLSGGLTIPATMNDPGQSLCEMFWAWPQALPLQEAPGVGR
jgi:hypothetical protein